MEGGERKDYTELAFLFIFNLPSVVKDLLLMETDLISLIQFGKEIWNPSDFWELYYLLTWTCQEPSREVVGASVLVETLQRADAEAVRVGRSTLCYCTIWGNWEFLRRGNEFWFWRWGSSGLEYLTMWFCCRASACCSVRILIQLLGEICTFSPVLLSQRGRPELLPPSLIFSGSEGSYGNTLDLIMAKDVFTSRHFKLMKNLENICLVIMQSPESSK